MLHCVWSPTKHPAVADPAVAVTATIGVVNLSRLSASFFAGVKSDSGF
jgi:hypothetical protein